MDALVVQAIVSRTATYHKHVIGLDRSLRRNTIGKYSSRLPNEMSKRPIGKPVREKSTNNKKTRKPNNKLNKNGHQLDTHEFIHDDDAKVGETGQHFHMDFGFVRRSKFRIK